MALAAIGHPELTGRWFLRHIMLCATEDLKIEDFKPEFAGKMNFYLSAVDDQLRHADDAPTIGIILCKGRNELIVEYALRDTSKPMGVTQYRLTPALPELPQNGLPTVEELAKEFPLLSVVKVRIEIESALREHFLPESAATTRQRVLGLGHLLRSLDEEGEAPPSTQELL